MVTFLKIQQKHIFPPCEFTHKRLFENDVKDTTRLFGSMMRNFLSMKAVHFSGVFNSMTKIRGKDSKWKFAYICNAIGTKYDSQEFTLTRFATKVQQVSKKIGEKKRFVKPLATQITSRCAQFTKVLLRTWSHSEPSFQSIPQNSGTIWLSMLSFNLSNGLFTIFLKNIKLKLAKYRCAIYFFFIFSDKFESKIIFYLKKANW